MEEQQWKHEESVLKDCPQEPLLINIYLRRLILISYGNCCISESCSGSIFYEILSRTVVVALYTNQKGCCKLTQNDVRIW